MGEEKTSRAKNIGIGAAYSAGATLGGLFLVAAPQISQESKQNCYQFDTTIADVRKNIVSQEYPSHTDIKGVYDKSLELTKLDVGSESKAKVESAVGKLEYFLGTYSEERSAEQGYGRAILIDTRDQLLEARTIEAISTSKTAANSFLYGLVLVGVCGYQAIKRLYRGLKPAKKTSQKPATS